MWLPTERKVRERLSGGQRRAEAYGICRPVGHVTAVDMVHKLRARAADTGQLRCYLCGLPLAAHDWQLDHVMPLAAGGNHEWGNLEAACSTCNLEKSDLVLFTPPLDDLRPLLVQLRARPIQDVWDETPELARKVLVRPRPVPVDPSIGEFRKLPLIVRACVTQPDPYRAMTVTQIAAWCLAQDESVSPGELDRDWLKLMGVSRKNSNDAQRRQQPHDRRLPPSPLVVPVRVRRRSGEWGSRGFRLRFRVPSQEAVVFATQRISPARSEAALKDHDEVRVLRTDTPPVNGFDRL